MMADGEWVGEADLVAGDAGEQPIVSAATMHRDAAQMIRSFVGI